MKLKLHAGKTLHEYIQTHTMKRNLQVTELNMSHHTIKDKKKSRPKCNSHGVEIVCSRIPLQILH